MIKVINEEPEAEFLLLLGDLTENTYPSEFDRIEAAFAQIKFPIYTTPGNHDVFQNTRYQDRFGRGTYTFTHKGVRFTSLDSASARIAPVAFDDFTRATDQGRDQPQVVFSHIPAFETVGIRSGAWNSRREGLAFLSQCVSAKVDLLLFGHIHSFDRYKLAGIPAFISGGGGAFQEKLDGIGRHYLRVHAHPATSTFDVEVVRVDP
jgi:3',5'-cyclic AMP phosphodiesterase CpdA